MDFESIAPSDYATRACIEEGSEVRSRAEVALVLELVRAGWNDCEIARETGIPRQTILDWRNGRTPDFDRVRTRTFPNEWVCVVCRGHPLTLPQAPYTYLLGLYLGDGYIASHARGVYRLRIYCANAYPELVRRCEGAMGEVIPTKVSRVACVGCMEVASFSKHWPCLFPQHGPGRKHERKIELVPWQQELVDRDPRPLIRGLLHSDGCRVLNWVNGTAYPRYHFSNVSADIRGIFGRACDQLGIEWRPNNPWSLSVARRGSVALLDQFVGPKR
jgi:Homeodomain-like domain